MLEDLAPRPLKDFPREIAEDMVETLRSIGGLHTMEDFAEHTTETTSPIGTTMPATGWMTTPEFSTTSPRGVMYDVPKLMLANPWMFGASPFSSAR